MEFTWLARVQIVYTTIKLDLNVPGQRLWRLFFEMHHFMTYDHFVPPSIAMYFKFKKEGVVVGSFNTSNRTSSIDYIMLGNGGTQSDYEGHAYLVSSAFLSLAVY